MNYILGLVVAAILLLGIDTLSGTTPTHKVTPITALNNALEVNNAHK
jgi:hypothetical protein